LRKGDIITDVAQKPVNSVEEVEELVASAKSEGRQSVLLLVRRDGQPRFIVLKFN
jgi:serine protease Do